ncbi:uracil-DNA glycosylase family protein [Mucilaginibacter ginsenosidivorax]|uniref:SMUG2 DNA glycosylase family protein n=1 Tax=Mucilaginibacter ginsenosidivorax TaxID=862126 RepID=A0A5B8VS76_9SPHI|nr:uracil-DNA glycosylase family protein [Mucilaginibacter ginsenosidivorax]QEC74494.1 SMUG2 DNA glycosylase family protein [Mucilaginibacter ginsenosidivorax]
MDTFADRIITFNQQLEYTGKLPPGVSIMNPFRDNDFALDVSTRFYGKYYSDNHPRHLVLGINPGRFGSGMTGVSFTDPKRMISKCQIPYIGPITHEPSSEYVYDMIEAFGGIERFYQQFYIHSVCPLGFTITGPKGKEINYNYYDTPELTKAVYPFIVENIKKQIAIGFETDVCFCFGTGKNEAFLRKLNDEHRFFKQVVALEHPRFIMQYKSKTKQDYIAKYLKAFNAVVIP